MTTDEAYRQYGRRILQRIWRQNVGPRSAEDLLHDVYVVVLQMRKRQRPFASVLGTLVAITRRLLKNYVRRRAHLARPGYDCDAAELADASSTDDDAEGRELLEAAFRLMRPEDQALIRLLDLEGMSVDEIAGSLGCPVNTMWSRYRRAKARLVEVLMQLDADPPPNAG
jgi:RNA polymerase sigma-70 factor (ECF subfamily)